MIWNHPGILHPYQLWTSVPFILEWIGWEDCSRKEPIANVSRSMMAVCCTLIQRYSTILRSHFPSGASSRPFFLGSGLCHTNLYLAGWSSRIPFFLGNKEPRLHKTPIILGFRSMWSMQRVVRNSGCSGSQITAYWGWTPGLLSHSIRRWQAPRAVNPRCISRRCCQTPNIWPLLATTDSVKLKGYAAALKSSQVISSLLSTSFNPSCLQHL